MISRALITAAVLVGGLLVAMPDAEARGFKRRGSYRTSGSYRANNFRDNTFSLPRGQDFSFKASASARRRVDYNYPQLNKQEKRFFYRQQAFFDHAFNGFSPYDFK